MGNNFCSKRRGWQLSAALLLGPLAIAATTAGAMQGSALPTPQT